VREVLTLHRLVVMKIGASSIPFIVTPIFMLVYVVAFVDLAIQHDDVPQPANLFVNSFIGNDNGNNCQNSTFPCQTIAHAIRQAGESDVIALNGKFVLNDTITLSRNITLTTWFWSNPPLLVCDAMTKVCSLRQRHYNL
jgi:hypothetical protein